MSGIVKRYSVMRGAILAHKTLLPTYADFPGDRSERELVVRASDYDALLARAEKAERELAEAEDAIRNHPPIPLSANAAGWVKLPAVRRALEGRGGK